MKTYNFSAGPACLPDPVLSAAGEAAKEYKKFRNEHPGNEPSFSADCVSF